MRASRLLQSVIVTACSGALPFSMADWHMTAARADSIQSACHVSCMSSLFAVGLLADCHMAASLRKKDPPQGALSSGF